MAILVRSWALLVALTLASMWVGTAAVPASHPLLLAGAVIGVSGFKAWTILRDFLGLRHTPRGTQAMFLLYVAVLCGLVFAAYAAAAFLHRPG